MVCGYSQFLACPYWFTRLAGVNLVPILKLSCWLSIELKSFQTFIVRLMKYFLLVSLLDFLRASCSADCIVVGTSFVHRTFLAGRRRISVTGGFVAFHFVLVVLFCRSVSISRTSSHVSPKVSSSCAISISFFILTIGLPSCFLNDSQTFKIIIWKFTRTRV